MIGMIGLISHYVELPWELVVQNVSGKFCVILDNFELVLDDRFLAHNNSIPLDFYKMYQDSLNWPLNCVSANKNLALDIVEDNPGSFLNRQWKMSCLSIHPSLTKEFIENTHLVLEKHGLLPTFLRIRIYLGIFLKNIRMVHLKLQMGRSRIIHN